MGQVQTSQAGGIGTLPPLSDCVAATEVLLRLFMERENPQLLVKTATAGNVSLSMVVNSDHELHVYADVDGGPSQVKPKELPVDIGDTSALPLAVRRLFHCAPMLDRLALRAVPTPCVVLGQVLKGGFTGNNKGSVMLVFVPEAALAAAEQGAAAAAAAAAAEAAAASAASAGAPAIAGRKQLKGGARGGYVGFGSALRAGLVASGVLAREGGSGPMDEGGGGSGGGSSGVLVSRYTHTPHPPVSTKKSEYGTSILVLASTALDALRTAS